MARPVRWPASCATRIRAVRNSVRKLRAPALLLAPALLIVLATSVYPLGYSLLTSLRSWRLMDSPVPQGFVGLGNYRDAFTDDPDFWDALRRTAVFVVADVGLTLVAALVLAVLLLRAGAARTLVRTLLILPFAMSPVLIGISWRFMLSPEFGVYSWLAGILLPPLQGIAWLADPVLSMVALVSADSWHWTPYFTFMLMGGLAGVPPETQEAARIDGAGELAIFRRITLPQIAPVLAVAAVLRTVFALKTFDMIVTMTSGGPGTSTTTLAYFAYQIGFRDYDMGYASAVAWVLTAILVGLSLVYMRMIFRTEPA